MLECHPPAQSSPGPLLASLWSWAAFPNPHPGREQAIPDTWAGAGVCFIPLPDGPAVQSWWGGLRKQPPERELKKGENLRGAGDGEGIRMGGERDGMVVVR